MVCNKRRRDRYYFIKLVDGVKTELKTLNGSSLNTPVTRIQDGFEQGAQTVIIDGRKTGLTLEQADTVINRALGKYGGTLPGGCPRLGGVKPPRL